MTLEDTIKRRIGRIPASHGGYISVAPSTLSGVLSAELLERIASEAADEARNAVPSEAVRSALRSVAPIGTSATTIRKQTEAVMRLLGGRGA